MTDSRWVPSADRKSRRTEDDRVHGAFSTQLLLSHEEEFLREQPEGIQGSFQNPAANQGGLGQPHLLTV